jgi:hypothetical protein
VLLAAAAATSLHITCSSQCTHTHSSASNACMCSLACRGKVSLHAFARVLIHIHGSART